MDHTLLDDELKQDFFSLDPVCHEPKKHMPIKLSLDEDPSARRLPVASTMASTREMDHTLLDDELKQDFFSLDMHPAGLAALDLNLHATIITYLFGYEAASISAVGMFLRQLLQESSIWRTFLKQEEPNKSIALPTSVCPKNAYIAFVAQSSCRALSWVRVPCSHSLGAREGSPAMFSRQGFLFVFGGWSRSGPSRDLHVGPLKHPLNLHRVPIAGNRPPSTYEMKVTVLGDSDSDTVSGKFRVAVTGGFLYGGYRGESGTMGIFEVSLPHDASTDGSQLPTARWCHTCAMTPRSNHTATYIPPCVAGPRYTHGCLLIFGGNSGGRATNTIDILDLEDMTWGHEQVSSGEIPSPRNSHSALLLPRGAGREVLVMGGCNGDYSNGGPPRGGSDIHTAFWLNPRSFEWQRARQAESSSLGRGHIAVNLSGTALVVGGGTHPAFKVTAFSDGGVPSGWEVEAVSGRSGAPKPRILGGGCLLGDGTFIMYGGWHPIWGTYGDFWAAHVVGVKTPFCAPLLGEASAAQTVTNTQASVEITNRQSVRRRTRRSNQRSAGWCARLQRLGRSMKKSLFAWCAWCCPERAYQEVPAED